MKYLKFYSGKTLKWGVEENGIISVIRTAPWIGTEKTGETARLTDVKLAAPVEPVSPPLGAKILCIGKNYYDHAVEFGEEAPETPIIFIKPNTVINDPNAAVAYPKITSRLDFEGELALIIGKKAEKVSEEDALEHVFGYTCFNDITARDIQQADGQWTRGKGCDGCGPIGPWIVTGLDSANLAIETRLNGKRVQSANTGLMMSDVRRIIAFVSASMTLMPGDIIATGTPAGVGPMLPGDVVEVEIENIGILKNTIV